MGVALAEVGDGLGEVVENGEDAALAEGALDDDGMGVERPGGADGAGVDDGVRCAAVEVERDEELDGIVGEATEGRGAGADEQAGIDAGAPERLEAGEGGQLGGRADEDEAAALLDVGGERLGEAVDGGAGGDDDNTGARERGGLQLGELYDMRVAEPFGAQDLGGVAAEAAAALARIGDDRDGVLDGYFDGGECTAVVVGSLWRA